MTMLRLILAVLLPPLGVWNRGCATVILVGIVTASVWIFGYLNNILLLAYWAPGILVALFMVLPDIRRTPAPTEDRSRDILSAGQAFKQQGLPGQSPTLRSQQAAQRTGHNPASTTDHLPQPPVGPPKPPRED